MEKIKDPIKQVNENIVFHYTNKGKGEWDTVTITLFDQDLLFTYKDIITKSIISNKYEYGSENTIETILTISPFKLVADYILRYYNENIEQYKGLVNINQNIYFSIGDIVINLNEFIVSKLSFQTIPVGGDGNCLFRALSLRKFGREERQNEIRFETVNLLKTNFEGLEYDVFKEQYNINDNDPKNRIPKLDDNYFNNMLKDREWGDTLEVVAFANLEPFFNAFTITNIQSSSLITSYPVGYPGDDNLPQNVIFLKNYRGTHYDLLTPIAFDINFDNVNNFNNNIDRNGNFSRGQGQGIEEGIVEEGLVEEERTIKEQVEITPGNFKIIFTDNDEYTGNVKDGKPEGQGELKFSDDNQFGYQEYKGQFYEGEMSGEGTLTFDDGATYKGHFKNGAMNGTGEIKYNMNPQTELEPYQTWLDNFKGNIRQTIGEYNIKGDYSNSLNSFKSNIRESNPNNKIIVSYNGQFIDGKKSGQGTMTFANGDVYTGEFFEDKITGKGQYKIKDGKIKYLYDFKIFGIIKGVTNFVDSYPEYDGQFDAKDKKTGIGIFRFKNGDIYFGQFQDNLITGDGILKYNNGNIYFGELINGQKVKKGIIIYDIGIIYDGDFLNDKFNGQGVIAFSPNDKEGRLSFNGTFKDDNMVQGTLLFKNGDSYIGQFQNGQMNGQGTLTQHGITVTGNFVNGKPAYTGQYNGKGQRNGTGTLQFQNGDEYRGDFKDDEIKGTGTIAFANGDNYDGQVGKGLINRALSQIGNFSSLNSVDNYINGQGTMRYNNGDVYTGNFDNGKRSGKGELTFSNGDVYKGEFDNDKITGTGTMTFVSPETFTGYNGNTYTGNVYTGSWLDGKPSGVGTLTSTSASSTSQSGTSQSGTVYQGNWTNGQPNPNNQLPPPITDPRLIPKLLKLLIKTNIPGYLEFEFNWTMIGLKSSQNGILFYPLIKLSQGLVDKLPEHLRKKSFENENLFRTLLNLNGSYYRKTLEEATKAGYPNNNIIVTLNTLFPNGTVLKLGNQPYVISGYLYDKNSWKIDSKINKIKPIDSSQYENNPILYSAIVNNELDASQAALQQLQQTPGLVYGANYTGPQVSVVSQLKQQNSMNPFYNYLGQNTGLGLGTGLNAVPNVNTGPNTNAIPSPSVNAIPSPSPSVNAITNFANTSPPPTKPLAIASYPYFPSSSSSSSSSKVATFPSSSLALPPSIPSSLNKSSSNEMDKVISDLIQQSINGKDKVLTDSIQNFFIYGVFDTTTNLSRQSPKYKTNPLYFYFINPIILDIISPARGRNTAKISNVDREEKDLILSTFFTLAPVGNSINRNNSISLENYERYVKGISDISDCLKGITIINETSNDIESLFNSVSLAVNNYNKEANIGQPIITLDFNSIKYGTGTNVFTGKVLRDHFNSVTKNVNPDETSVYEYMLQYFKLKLFILDNVNKNINIKNIKSTVVNYDYYVFILLTTNKYSLITTDYKKYDPTDTFRYLAIKPCSYTSIFRNTKTPIQYNQLIDFTYMIPPIYMLFLMYISVIQNNLQMIPIIQPFIMVINQIIKNFFTSGKSNISDSTKLNKKGDKQKFEEALQTVFNLTPQQILLNNTIPVAPQKTASKSNLALEDEVAGLEDEGKVADLEDEGQRRSRRPIKPAEIKGQVAAEQQKLLLNKGRRNLRIRGQNGGASQSGGAGDNFYSVPQINFGASSLSYYATIYLELEKGTVLTTSKMASASCTTGYNKILFNLAKFLGQEPVIQPDLNKLPDSILKPMQSINNNSSSRSRIRNISSNSNSNSSRNRRFNTSRRGGKPLNKNKKTKKLKNNK